MEESDSAETLQDGSRNAIERARLLRARQTGEQTGEQLLLGRAAGLAAGRQEVEARVEARPLARGGREVRVARQRRGDRGAGRGVLVVVGVEARRVVVGEGVVDGGVLLVVAVVGVLVQVVVLLQ